MSCYVPRYHGGIAVWVNLQKSATGFHWKEDLFLGFNSKSVLMVVIEFLFFNSSRSTNGGH